MSSITLPTLQLNDLDGKPMETFAIKVWNSKTLRFPNAITAFNFNKEYVRATQNIVNVFQGVDLAAELKSLTLSRSPSWHKISYAGVDALSHVFGVIINLLKSNHFALLMKFTSLKVTDTLYLINAMNQLDEFLLYEKCINQFVTSDIITKKAEALRIIYNVPRPFDNPHYNLEIHIKSYNDTDILTHSELATDPLISWAIQGIYGAYDCREYHAFFIDDVPDNCGNTFFVLKEHIDAKKLSEIRTDYFERLRLGVIIMSLLMYMYGNYRYVCPNINDILLIEYDKARDIQFKPEMWNVPVMTTNGKLFCKYSPVITNFDTVLHKDQDDAYLRSLEDIMMFIRGNDDLPRNAPTTVYDNNYDGLVAEVVNQATLHDNNDGVEFLPVYHPYMESYFLTYSELISFISDAEKEFQKVKNIMPVEGNIYLQYIYEVAEHYSIIPSNKMQI